MDRLTIPDEHIEGGIRRTVIDARAVRKEAMTIYWALKEYEDTGLTPEEIMDGELLTGWILPEERLPDEGQGVLVSTVKYVCLVEYDSDYEFGEVDGVLAWMPLPEPYKPEN